MKRLSLWLESLEPRERLLVTIAGSLLVLLLVYVAAVAPFYRAVTSRAARVERKQEDLAWLRSMAPAVRQIVMSQPGSASGESLVVLIDRTARQAGLDRALTGQTPNGDHGMRVRLESANFDSLVAWLSGLQQQYGVGVESANIDRTDKSGMVNASLVLTRS
jgi:general secretion pathway protein M